jgi:hypothetical protein
MAAVDLEIADAVVTALEAATLSKAISPVRSYAEWEEALEDFDELHVDVVPLQTGPATELDDRGSVEYTCEIDIGVRYRFGTSEQESTTGRVGIDEVDGLKLLVQEIAELFITDRFADSPFAIWQDTTIKLSWSRKHLRQMRQFFGFVRLTFLATRSL